MTKNVILWDAVLGWSVYFLFMAMCLARITAVLFE